MSKVEVFCTVLAIYIGPLAPSIVLRKNVALLSALALRATIKLLVRLALVRWLTSPDNLNTLVVATYLSGPPENLSMLKLVQRVSFGIVVVRLPFEIVGTSLLALSLPPTVTALLAATIRTPPTPFFLAKKHPPYRSTRLVNINKKKIDRLTVTRFSRRWRLDLNMGT